MWRLCDIKELCSWRGGAGRLVRLVRARDQHQVANIDNRSNALSCDKNWIFSIDGIGEGDEPADKAHIPKRDRDLALRLFFRGNPLHHPAAEKQPLAQKSDGEPDMLNRDGHHGTVWCNRREAHDGRLLWSRSIACGVCPAILARPTRLSVTCCGMHTATREFASSGRRSGRRGF